MHMKAQFYTEIKTLVLRDGSEQFEVSLFRIAPRTVSPMGASEAGVHSLEDQQIAWSRSGAEALSSAMLKGALL